MKVQYEKELNRVSLHVDLPRLYEEDYQMCMLRENNIPGLLEITGCGINGKSRYSYIVTGMISMKRMFQTSAIRRENIETFVNCLMEVVKKMQHYMLNPDGLLLYPEFLFFGNDTWSFCYLPNRKKPLCEGFHVITEYFVKRLDYKETEGIMLAYELHKATLQENYDLEQIMHEYKVHKEKRRVGESIEVNEEQGNLPREHIISLEEEEYETEVSGETVCETGEGWNLWKKATARLQKGKWGKWRDLILETDGHEDQEPL